MKKSALLLALFLSVQPAIYAQPKLAPYQASWCAALLRLQRPSDAYNSTSLYTLRDVSRMTEKALDDLRNKPKNLLHRFRGQQAYRRGFAGPNVLPLKVSLSAIDQLEPFRQNEAALEAVLGRMELLEKDVTSLQSGGVAFGVELVGKDAIVDYLSKLKIFAAALDPSRAGFERYPVFARQKLLGYAVIDTINLFVSSAFVAGAYGAIESHSLPLMSVPIVLGALLGPKILGDIKESAFYYRARWSEKARIQFENQYNPSRLPPEPEQVDTMLSLVQASEKNPNALVYSGYGIGLPVEILDEMLTASDEKRDYSAEVFLKALDKYKTGVPLMDQRFVLIDQIYYVDSQTRQPVLMSFVRIKKASDFGASGPPRRAFTSKTSVEDAIGSAGLPAPAR